MVYIIIIPLYFEEPSLENSSYPCELCSKNIGKKHKYIRCNLCNYRIHTKCNKIDDQSYENIKKNGDPQYCLRCQEEIFPFQKLTMQQFFATSKSGIDKDVDSLNLSVFPMNRLKTFFKEINNLSLNNKEEEVDTGLVKRMIFKLGMSS